MPSKSMKRVLMVNVWEVTPGSEKQSYLYEPLAELGYELELIGVPGGNKLKVLYGCMTADIRFDDYAGIICPEYGRAVGMAFRKRIGGHSTPIVAVGLNQAASLFKTGLGVVDCQVDKVVEGISLAIVHSQHERDLWTDIHNIPPERMPFAHWGYDLPDITTSRFSQNAEPYFCMIGRNNRDYSTFCAAVKRAGVRGIIVTDAVCAQNLPTTDDIEVYLDLSLDDCLDCIRGSLANVILVNDDKRGAGHITAVSGMHLGKPTIYTDCRGLADYLVDRHNGLAVPLGDSVAVAEMMGTLFRDSGLSSALGKAGQRYAGKWLTTKAAGLAHASAVVAGIEGRPFPPAPPEWSIAYEGLQKVR